MTEDRTTKARLREQLQKLEAQEERLVDLVAAGILEVDGERNEANLAIRQALPGNASGQTKTSPDVTVEGGNQDRKQFACSPGSNKNYLADLTVESLHIIQIEARRWRTIIGSKYEDYNRMNRHNR